MTETPRAACHGGPFHLFPRGPSRLLRSLCRILNRIGHKVAVDFLILLTIVPPPFDPGAQFRVFRHQLEVVLAQSVYLSLQPLVLDGLHPIESRRHQTAQGKDTRCDE